MTKLSKHSSRGASRPTPNVDAPVERILVVPPLPARPVEGHKGLFGRVLVVGGSETMFGAATLAAMAALTCGSGLVQLAVPRDVLPFALSVTPELIGLELSPNAEKPLRAAALQADVLVIGPGMGQTHRSRKYLLDLLKLGKPTLLDADALNLLAAEKKWPKKLVHAVLTPHPGEMARLCGRLGVKSVPSDARGRLALATLAARQFETTILLKGHHSVVTDGRRAYVNRTGNSTLSKAGSGDVLSGIIGSLMGQGMNTFDAACAGAWLHGRAGEIAGEVCGPRSALARDVIASLHRAIAEYPVTAAG